MRRRVGTAVEIVGSRDLLMTGSSASTEERLFGVVGAVRVSEQRSGERFAFSHFSEQELYVCGGIFIHSPLICLEHCSMQHLRLGHCSAAISASQVVVRRSALL